MILPEHQLQPAPDTMRTNVVLIDFESVQPESLAPLAQDHFKILVFVGASQAKLSFEIAASLQPLGPRAEYIKISGQGPNALDFHIAYYIGQLAAADARAYFHIVSKDTGFDPLIQHLQSKRLSARRVPSIADIPLVKAAAARSTADRVQVVLSRLQQMKSCKPGTVKTLTSSIAALFQKQLSAKEITTLIEALAKQGHLSVAGTKITYAGHDAG